jgi:hypothetical protein
VVEGSKARVSETRDSDDFWEIRILPSDPTAGSRLWDVVVWDHHARKLIEAAAIHSRTASPLELTLRALGRNAEISVYDASLNE